MVEYQATPNLYFAQPLKAFSKSAYTTSALQYGLPIRLADSK
jgi:hypothetical protein